MFGFFSGGNSNNGGGGGNASQPQGQSQGTPIQGQNPIPGQGQIPRQGIQNQGQSGGQNPDQNQGQSQGVQDTQNPLDFFASALHNKGSQGEDSAFPQLNLDPNQLNTIASKQDFTREFSDEALAAAMQNPAQMRDFMNKTLRQAYATALSHSALIMNNHTKSYDEFNRQNITKTLASDRLKEEVTRGADHPAVKDQLQMIAQSLAQANPGMSPKQIREMTLQVVQGMGDFVNKMGKEPNGTQSQQQPGSNQSRGLESYF